MKSFIEVTIPFKAKTAYTLYAKGFQIDTPEFLEDAKFARFRFLRGSVFILFYTFTRFRRAYIVRSVKNDKSPNLIFLPGVNEHVELLCKWRGKKIDLLKRYVFLFMKESDEIFRFPITFWRTFIGVLECFGGAKSDVLLLYERYRKK